MSTKYVCQFCKATFVQKSSLNRHLSFRCLLIKDPQILLELLEERQNEIDKLNEHIHHLDTNDQNKIIVVKLDDKKKIYKYQYD